VSVFNHKFIDNFLSTALLDASNLPPVLRKWEAPGKEEECLSGCQQLPWPPDDFKKILQKSDTDISRLLLTLDP